MKFYLTYTLCCTILVIATLSMTPCALQSDYFFRYLKALNTPDAELPRNPDDPIPCYSSSGELRTVRLLGEDSDLPLECGGTKLPDHESPVLCYGVAGDPHMIRLSDSSEPEPILCYAKST